MIQKILWATDGSEDSLEALRYVELFARRLNAGVVGLCVIPDYPEVVEGFSSEEKKRFEDWIKGVREAEEKRLKDIEGEMRAKGISFKIIVSTGIPDKEILEVSDREKVGLIALGRGRAKAGQTLGSTSLKVIRGSKCPVLTVGKAKDKLDIRKILVPMDLSHHKHKNLEFALWLSKKFKAVVYVLNVVEVGECRFPPEITEGMKLYSQKSILENLGRAKLSGEADIKAHVEVARNAYTGIVNFSAAEDIDLIVITTYGGRKFKNDFIGSVTERVVQESPCPVITLNPVV
ncbi:hypothetical protein HRbin37_02146 [bacterium HR37]|nr:hypothetical protein HRbin37_02146 [bacterium HR37]